MKILTSTLHAFVMICCLLFSPVLYAQSLCVTTPTNSTDFTACNRNIASTFAPVIVQYVTTDTDFGLGGNADRLVP
ncbi:MAG: hypothetical protein AAGD05_07155, partial [Bacteroidota bacterium]